MARLSLDARIAVANALITDIGAAAQIALIDRSTLNPTDTPTTGVDSETLAVLTGGNPFAGPPNPANALITANGITSATIQNSGTVQFVRISTSGGTPKLDLTASATGGGGDIEFTTVSLVANGQAAISALTITPGDA